MTNPDHIRALIAGLFTSDQPQTPAQLTAFAHAHGFTWPDVLQVINDGIAERIPGDGCWHYVRPGSPVHLAAIRAAVQVFAPESLAPVMVKDQRTISQRIDAQRPRTDRVAPAPGELPAFHPLRVALANGVTREIPALRTATGFANSTVLRWISYYNDSLIIERRRVPGRKGGAHMQVSLKVTA